MDLLIKEILKYMDKDFSFVVINALFTSIILKWMYMQRFSSIFMDHEQIHNYDNEQNNCGVIHHNRSYLSPFINLTNGIQPRS